MNIGDRDAFVEDVRKALYVSKVVAYAQGFDQIKVGSEAFGWNVEVTGVAPLAPCIVAITRPRRSIVRTIDEMSQQIRL